MSASSLKAKSSNKLHFPLRLFPFVFLFCANLCAAAETPAELIPQITQDLNQRYLSFQNLRAYMELELSQPGISPHRSFAQLAFKQQGERLYFKTFSQLTPHYFTLITNENSFWLQIPKTKTIYTGPVEAIGKEHFELKITPQDFRKILVPNPVEQTPDNLRLEEQPGHWLLAVYSPIGQTGQTFKERELWLDKSTLRALKDTRFSANGNPYLEIRWEEFESDHAGGTFPSLITLFKPTTGYLLRLKFKKWSAAGTIPDGLFETANRKSYRIETISVK